ncbi:MAG: ABC transporter ATP-binding protein [Treponema sp.]|uniref:ABC transporter ATP-binding protein n=1 Tax=Treponema sp. TaxID=166 RepID=UPI003FA2EB84
MKEIPLEMLSSYLSRSYIDMININSAEAMRGLSSNSTSVYYIIQSIFLIVSNLLTVGVIGAFLIMVDTTMSFRIISIAVLFISTIVMVLKKTVQNSGKKFDYSMFLVTKVAYEALTGLKEINIMKRNRSFISKYEDAVELKRKAELRYRFLQESPSVLIETIFICILIVIVFFKMTSGLEPNVLVAQLSVFAYGAMRILPCISAISAQITSIIYYTESFSSAYTNIFEAREYKHSKQQFIRENDSPKSLTFSKITIEHLTWQYKKDGKIILDDISFEINRGDSIALIGKSGAGKSTFADILLGVLSPSQGKVMVDNIDVYSIPLQWAKTVGFVPQSIFLLDDTIRNNIVFGDSDFDGDDKRIFDALEQAQLKDFVAALPDGLDTVVGERGIKFSGGQRQRLAIARALYGKPEILVLDEATAALDTETETAVMDAINVLKGKITLVIIAHRLSTIKQCNKVYEITNGKLEKR